MCLWFLALKARKAGNRPRTFYTGLTVVSDVRMSYLNKGAQVVVCQRHTGKDQAFEGAEPEDVTRRFHVHDFERNLWAISLHGLSQPRIQVVEVIRNSALGRIERNVLKCQRRRHGPEHFALVETSLGQLVDGQVTLSTQLGSLAQNL